MSSCSNVIRDLYHHRRVKAAFVLAFCIVCLLASLACLVICLLAEPSELTPERGKETFHLFTVNSNLFMALACSTAIPFAVEGLRKDRVHLPTWCLLLLYMGVIGVTLTFCFAVAFIFPFMGTYLAFGSTNFFLHLICPVLAVLLFTLLASDHRMKFKDTFLGLIFFACYAVVYIINVGGGRWRDVYQLNTKIPFVVSIPMMLALAFGIATALRLLHNKICAVAENKALKQIRAYVKIPEGTDLRDVVYEIARSVKANPHIVTIPVDDLLGIAEVMGSSATREELCKMYLDGYYNR